MSGFTFLRGDDGLARADKLRAGLGRVGVTYDKTVSFPEGQLLFRSNPYLSGGDWCAEPDTFACFTGMFFFEDAFGRDAVARFLRRFDPERPSLDDTAGQFCLIVRKHNRLFFFTDALGMNKLYCDQRRSILSSQFLGVAEGFDRRTVDDQGCYEYAWNGVSMGERTFCSEVRTLPVEHFAVVGADGVGVQRLDPVNLRERDAAALSDSELVERHLARARRLFRLYAEHFRDRISLSMSGGYDSRLLLALFLDAGVRPHVFSYGKPDDTDVARAMELARAENLPFEIVDKSNAPVLGPAEYKVTLERTYGLFDGWKVDGIFDSGADAADRTARVAGGRVKVNGSAGEIYRNFFYLRDRPLSSAELVWSFYSRFDPRACTDFFDPRAYEAEIARRIALDVGADAALLQRHEVELAYPLVRVRYWTARDVQLNQGFGPCLFPFLEPRLIRGTCDIPLRLKSHGVLEGRMIRALNGRLAACRLDHGFDVSRDPPLSYRLKAQFTYLRPPRARRFVYRFKQPRRLALPWYLEKPYLEEVIDTDFPVMRRYFRLDRIRDVHVYNRIATMEYHFERGSRG